MPSKGNDKGKATSKKGKGLSKGSTFRKTAIDCLREHLDHICQSILEAIKETQPSSVIWSIHRKQKTNTEARHYYDQEWELLQGNHRILKLSVSTHNPPKGAFAYLYVTGSENGMHLWDDLYYDVIRPIVLLCGGKNPDINVKMLVESLPEESVFRQECLAQYRS